MSDVEAEEAARFVELMTVYQGRLYGYLLSLAGDSTTANDLLQETNVVLWKEWRQFAPDSNFKAWSFRIAHFQFMAYRQKKLREKVLFSDDLVSLLSEEASACDEFHEERLAALEECLDDLPDRARTAIRLRYSDGLAAEEIGERMNRKPNAVYQILFRARQTLIDCVQSRRPAGSPS